MDLTVEKDVLTLGATRTCYQKEGDEILVAERGHGQFRGSLFLGESLDREHTGDVRRRRFGTDTPTAPATATTDVPPVAVGLSRTVWTTKRKLRTDMHFRHLHLNAPTGRQRRFTSRRSKDPAAWVGQGTAWLVHDTARDCYHCYWLVGRPNDHLIERATLPSAADAVDWAASRTHRARIRLDDHRTYWAGIDPAPAGFAGTWTPAIRPATVPSGPVFPETQFRPALAQTA